MLRSKLRYWIASDRWSTWIFSESSISAIVRETLRIRVYARADRPNSSSACFKRLSDGSSNLQYFFIWRLFIFSGVKQPHSLGINPQSLAAQSRLRKRGNLTQRVTLNEVKGLAGIRYEILRFPRFTSGYAQDDLSGQIASFPECFRGPRNDRKESIQPVLLEVLNIKQPS